MFEKLMSYYNQSLLLTEPPNYSYYSNYHWFKDDTGIKWLGIPFEAIQKQELSLLKTLFQYVAVPYTIHPIAQKWYDFLYFDGEIPSIDPHSAYRYNLFHLSGTGWEKSDLEEAMYGFFPTDSIILWEDQEHGIIIERNPEPKKDENLILSLNHTLESDFFMKAYFYCGKIQPVGKKWQYTIKEDQYFFENAIKRVPSQAFHSFEKSFPFMLSDQIPKKMQEWLHSQILIKIMDEPELLTAVKRFLENNSNATLTAKELYIHRNTLQYRLDKFSTKTGINLKDFHSTITVYLACLLSETDRQ